MVDTGLMFFSLYRLSLQPRDRSDGRGVGKEKICLRHEDSLSAYEFAEESDGDPEAL